jgi:hypothetical protein
MKERENGWLYFSIVVKKLNKLTNAHSSIVHQFLEKFAGNQLVNLVTIALEFTWFFTLITYL